MNLRVRLWLPVVVTALVLLGLLIFFVARPAQDPAPVEPVTPAESKLK